ncbi:MAG: ThiF family adenylyltransferase [Chloroflexi bacterium]|nr:ThiF family adenylyltransferase [Chloroflexota bacterium]
MIDRYSRQLIFPGIGEEGQAKLANSFAVIVGCGALGTVIATALVRAGAGKVRIIDRDFIEYHNLQRQVLFDEDDIRHELPKATAAERHLKKVNSSIEIEGIVADVNYTNVEGLISGADVVMDGLDNLETRGLVNDACLKLGIPWVYGSAISSSGMTMTVIPHDTPCFRCISISASEASGAILTCDTAGVISPAPFVVGSLQTAEALKLLVGARRSINRDLICVDVWEGTFVRISISSHPDCPACQGKYQFLNGKAGLKAVSLCGQNAVQVLNTSAGGVSFPELAARLKPVAKVSYNDFMLQVKVDNHEMVVFPDGRAIVKNTNDLPLARGLYAKYIGT